MAAESLDFVKEVVRKVWGKFIEHFDARTNVDSLFSQKLIDESTMHVILAAKATKDANRAFLLYLLDHATTDSLKTLRKLLCDTSGTFQRHGSLARSLEGPLKLGKIPLPSPVAVRRVANGGSRPSSPQSSISEHTHTVISEEDQTSRLGAVAALDLHIYKDPYQLSPQSSYSEDYLNEDKIDLRVQDSFLCVLAQVAKILNKFFNDLKTVLQRYLKDERRPFDQLDPEYIDSAADIQAIFRKIQIEDFWLNTSPLLRLINVVSHKASRERAIKLLDKYHEDLKSLSTVVLLKHIPKHDISDDRLERWRSSVEHLAVTFDLEFENFQLSDLFAQQEFLSRIFKIPPSAFSYLSSGPTASTVVNWALHISASQAFEILERAQCAFWRLKEHLIIKVEIEGTFQFHLRGKHLPHLIKKALHRNQEFLTFTEHISHQFLALVDYSHFKRRDFHQRGGYQPIGVDPEAVGSDVHETESRTPIGSTLSEKYADVQMDQEPNSASTRRMTRKLGTFWSRTVTSTLSKLFAQFAEVIRQPPQPVHDDGPGGGPTEEEHSDPAPAKTMRPVSYSKGSGSSSFPSSSDGPTGGPKGSLSGVASVSSPSLPSKIPAVEGVYAKPTAPELWKHAGQHMHSEWYKFGVVLQVSENILKSIKTANSSVTDDCFLILSQQWLRKGNGTGEAPRTWRTVLEAVRRCGFPDLAKEVKKLIHQEHRDGERQPLLQGVPENNPRYGEPPRTPSSTFSTAYQQPIEEEGGRPRGESCIEPPRKGSRLVVMESHTHKEVTESLVSTESLPEDTTYILKPGSSYTVQLGSKSVKIIAPDPSSLNDVADLMPMSCDSDTPSTDQPRPQLYVDCFKSIPPNIDQLVELSMIELLPYIEKLAPKWDKIGNSLGLEDKVRVLRVEPSAPTLTGKMSMLFESWLDSGNDVSWHTLVTVLRSVGCQRAAIAMSSYLHDQVHDLPPDIDDQVPVEMRVLIKIVSKVAPYWEKIGYLLKLYDTLKELKGSKSSNLVKMTILLETWAERRDNGTTWAVLLSVLEKDVELLGEGAKLRHYILEELKRRQDKRPSVSHLT